MWPGMAQFYPVNPDQGHVYFISCSAFATISLIAIDYDAGRAAHLSISKHSPVAIDRRKKERNPKDGRRTLVNVASLKAYHMSLLKESDNAPVVFGGRVHVLPRSRQQARSRLDPGRCNITCMVRDHTYPLCAR